jgi:predicted lipoprotein with Yx(FWY)xxD motif
MRTLTSIALLTATLLTGCASMSGGMSPTQTRSGVLTDDAGMTLYVFDKDSPGKSACNGECAVKWPPLIAAGSASGGDDYTIINRDDGARQWAYKGKPLYRWFKDQKAGDTTGDGVNNVWHVAKP